MTSIVHPVLPGAVPAVGGSSASSLPERLSNPAGSKALRVGLGVAIAAVMAGDVYAVLRSPVSEGRGVGSASSAAMLEDGSGASGFASTAGHVAMNPFSEAAWGASTVPTSSSPFGAFGSGPAPAAATPAAASSVLPTAPVSSAPVIVLPAMPSNAAPSTFQPPAPVGPGGGDTSGDPQVETPAASPLMQTVTPVVTIVEQTVPQAAPVTQVVTDVVTQVDAVVPTQELAPVVEQVAPVTSGLGGLL